MLTLDQGRLSTHCCDSVPTIRRLKAAVIRRVASILCLPWANRYVQRDEDWLSQPGDEKER
jgi:hypothetical protein